MRVSASRFRTIAVGSALLVAVLVLSSCTTSDSPPASGDGQGFYGGQSSTIQIPIDERDEAPDVAGVTLDGDQVSLSDFEGDVVVLNVWSSWCGPCREEAPTLREVSLEYKNQGVQFLGLNNADDDAAARAFERNYDIDYPSLVDTDGQLQLEFRDTLPPGSLPSTVVIDSQGRVAASVIGATTYTQLKGLVSDVLREKG